MNNFNGQVLPGARSSTSNADTTGAISSGVSRAVYTTDGALYPTVQDVDIQGARYRATLLESGSTTEYLLWAANSGPLVVAPGTSSTNGTVTIPTGTITVGAHEDGTDHVVLTDNGGANIATVPTLVFVQGGTTIPVTLFSGIDYTFDPVSGVITLTILVVSASRGDRFTATYTLDGARFNWTRNDPTGTRFGWNGAHRKWEPFKGGAVENLGLLAGDTRFTLSPVPVTPVGSYLPGSNVVGQYAMLRLGASPGEASYPVVAEVSFSGVLVVTDDLANMDYNFNSVIPPLSGVVGVKSGLIAWNPAFVTVHEGETLWYSSREFDSQSKGVVGSVLDVQYIAPVPTPLERPLLRFGQRAYLNYLSVENETQLALLVVPQGSVGVALSTGKVKLNALDVAKANPVVGNPNFNPLYLEVNLRYEGVALNRYPQPVQAPVQLTLIGQTWFVPDALLGLPGTGVSGMVVVPDGTGNTPDLALPVKPRPVSSGLVRRLTPGFGDAFLYGVSGRVTNLVPVNWDVDLPTDIYNLPLDTAYVSLQSGEVRMGSSLQRQLANDPVYFVQALVTPSLYPDGARLFSRVRDSFTFESGLSFEFRVDGVNYTYAPLPGTFTATQVALALNGVLGVGGTAGVVNGYLYIASNAPTGTVGIGFDEVSCRALGYPPGWLATDPGSYNRSDTDPNWLPDTGLSYGLSRSPVNLDGSQDAPDVRATYRATDAVLSESLVGVPYQLLTYPPREDIAGYDTGVFFALSGGASPTTVQVQTPLNPYTDVLYQFDQARFGWVSPFSFATQVLSPVSSINLGNGGVVPSTFYTVMGGYLHVSTDGGPQQDLELGVDFLVPDGSGTAILIERIGPLVQSGYRATITGSVLTDTSTTITAVNGDRLKIVSGAMAGLSFTVTASTVTTITVTPAFPSVAPTNTSWELYKGVDPGSTNGINPAVVGDVVNVDFNHLPSEPYEVRLFTNQGIAGGPLSDVDLPTANSGRVLSVRFGQTGLEVPLTVLTNSVLGAITNGPALAVPTVGTRFTSGAFSLVVGTTVFVNGATLLPVAVFSPDPGANIEYLTTTGDLKFGSTVLADYQSATVVYREETRTSLNIPAGVAEVSPFTGDLAVSSVDATANLGSTVYLVDLQPFEDVYLNPILGTFTFKKPVKSGQLVLATYFRAVPDSGALVLVDGSPVQVTEFLPVFIRQESAVRVDQQLYSFNGAGRTIDIDINPAIYVGTKLVTYGIPIGVSISYATNTFSVNDPVLDPALKVTISYAVFEALGGETTYSVSQRPVWRPPFKLTAGASTFVLDTDRTTDIGTPGVLLRIGNYVTYVRGATYNALTDLTTVTIFPTPITNVGSLAPSDSSINLLTDRPVTPVVDPGGVTPTITTADPWFLPKLIGAYGLTNIPAFQTVSKGQTTIRFDGDLTLYMVVGHVIELFGIPFLIAKSEMVDGTYTEVTLGSPSPIEMVWTPVLNPGLVRVSVRPIYPEFATVFVGAGGFVSTEPFEVVLFAGVNPGVTLDDGVDYQVDQSSGSITLLQPRQGGLPRGSSLRFYRTIQTGLAPFVFQGVVQYPRVSVSAAFIDPPSSSNGRLGAYLTATYTFDSPDSFYARSVSLPTYINETAVSIVQGVTSTVPGNNPSVGTFGKSTPSVQGAAGLLAQRQDLVSKDRVTRTFLRYFNGIVTSFEQVLENINGNPIGDRDGKLRLWMSTGDPFTPPGYEDGITGAINPRNVWSDVWNGYRVTPIALIDSDPIISPLTATLDVNGNPVGQSLPTSTLNQLENLQSKYVQNDVDDVVLTGLRDTSISLAGLIFFQTTSYGAYRALSEPSAFSRLFPEKTQAFTTSVPGIGYDPTAGNNGVYAFTRLSLDLFGAPPSISLQSTLGSPIAQLANPVRGNITSVQGVDVQDRRARARLFGYSPTGYLGVTVRPAFSATVLPLDVFHLTPTGTLDTSGLVAVAGIAGTPDLTTGDPTLHTPPFKPGDQVALGALDGTIYGLGYSGTTVLVGLAPVFVGVFVDTVIQGAYVTLKTYDAVGGFIPITAGNVANLVRLTSPNTGVTLTATMVEKGDTLFVVPTTGSTFTVAPADPPTTDELNAYAASLPTYRTGFDVGFDGRSGALVDITFPSFLDPNIFGLKEILGQRPPLPVKNLQATVTFQNADIAPSKIPALRGQARLDSGDYSLPYYGIAPTELSTLGDTFAAGIEFITLDAVSPPDNPPAPGYPLYVLEAAYPDEVLGDDGVVTSLPAAPAALVTAVDLNPAFFSHSGVGSVMPYDLLFVQQDTGGLPNGSTGILTVGAVTYGAPSVIEPPRFVSQADAQAGFPTSINVEAIQSYVEADPPNAPPHATGMQVLQDVTGPNCITTFELIGVPGLVFDDNLGGGGLPVPVGGFNTYFTASVKNPSIRINLMTPAGAFVPAAAVYMELAIGNPSILLTAFNVSGDNGVTPVLAVQAYFNTTKLVVETVLPFFDFASYGGGFIPGPGLIQLDNRDFTIDVIGTDSNVFVVAADRLTVFGPIDTRRAANRGALNPTGQPMQCALEILKEKSWFVDAAAVDIFLNTEINHRLTVNDGDPFTFIPRSYAPFTTSTFGVGGDLGGGLFILKAMPFEGHKNTPIAGSAITFSAAASSRQDGSSAILTANAYSDRMEDPGFPHTTKWGDNRFIPQAPILKGSVAQVLPGDIVVIQSASEDPGFTQPRITGKAGTHLVRGAMESLGGFPDQRQVVYTVPDLTGEYSTGWLAARFPTVVSATATDLFVSNIEALPVTQDWGGAPTAQTHIFPGTGRVYVVVSEAGLSSVVPGVFAASMVSAAYTSIDTVNMIFQGLNAFQDANGAGITSVQFVAAAVAALKVSGFTLLPLNPSGNGIPENLPGYSNADPGNLPFAAFGLRNLSATRGAALLSWVANSTGQMAPIGPTTGTLDVYEKVKQASNVFLPLDAPVYDDIPGAMVTGLPAADWDRLHNPAAPAPSPFPLVGVRCFLPGDTWAIDYSGAAGIYVEPSFPRTANNLANTFRNVVDAGNPSLTSLVGVRRMTDYVTDTLNPGDTWIEVTQLEVRRPRRFHEVSTTLAEHLLELRYSYEIRRGITTSVVLSGGYSVLTASPVSNGVPPFVSVLGSATQLGSFTNKLVNVHPGDEVRFLDTNGVVTDRATVVKVTGDFTLTLSKRLTFGAGVRFEIYLRVPPVPHEQSNEELLGFATDTVVMDRSVNYVAQTGGVVSATNVLSDTDGRDYEQAGVIPGDILLIDPAGNLNTPLGPTTPPQFGRRPYGDNGVLGRTGYAAGSPARADDNRGYYRVATVPGTTLTVSAIGGLAGNNGADVTFGNIGTTEYAVYPTIHASILTLGTEGQMDLRETALPVGMSYRVTAKSVGPFAYRIIRPTKLLTTPTVELILAVRERMLSWMEEIRRVRFKFGTYFVFQQDQHILELGSPLDPELGLGLLSNAYLEDLIGRWKIAPFTNTRDCLSVLDRRFWVLDFRLDTLKPRFGPFMAIPYADFENGVGRPVEVDRINEALDGRDRLRATRYSWLSLRTDRVRGTLENIRRFDVELPKRQAEAEQALAAVQSVEKLA